MAKHPMQPVESDSHGVVRFKENAIVRWLLDSTHVKSGRKVDLNMLALMEFSDEDREQFAQLIGYSVSGYHELPYVSNESAAAASAIVKEQTGVAIAGCRDTGCGWHTHDNDD